MSFAMLSERRRVSLCSDLRPLIGIRTLGMQNSEKKVVGGKVTWNNLGICFLFPIPITPFPKTSGNLNKNGYQQMSESLVQLGFLSASSTFPLAVLLGPGFLWFSSHALWSLTWSVPCCPPLSLDLSSNSSPTFPSCVPLSSRLRSMSFISSPVSISCFFQTWFLHKFTLIHH